VVFIGNHLANAPLAMEQFIKRSLTDRDKLLLSKIAELYTLGEQLFGNEPYIYAENGYASSSETGGSPAALSATRQGTFAGKHTAKTKSK
jgi:hypothetical protein